MKQHKHKGFTLVEVLIGFVMLSFIVVMVSTVMTSGFMLSARIHELPNAYYGAQDDAEREIDTISALVKEKFRLLSDLGPLPINYEEADPDLVNKYFEVQGKLDDDYTMETLELFGKSVEIYKKDVDFAYEDNKVFVTLHVGVVNAEKLERKVPVISEVSIKPKSGNTQDLYYAKGLEIECTVDYDSKNYNQRYKELYQWYIGTGGFHTAMYSAGTYPETEVRYGELYTRYPISFTLLPGETRSTITLKEEYYGQMLVCVVTPLSKNGAMGESVDSNSLYISALPKLSTGQYRMLIDVSATPYTYTTEKEVDIATLSSRNDLTSKLSAYSSSQPKLSMKGAATDSHLASAPAQNGTWTRFLAFTGSTYMTASGWSGSNAQAFVVARKTNDVRDMNFIGSGTNKTAGFVNNIRKTDGSGDTRWQLLQVNLPTSGFTIGREAVEVAELIVVTGASNAEKDAIWAYLLNKYRIKDNNQN